MIVRRQVNQERELYELQFWLARSRGLTWVAWARMVLTYEALREAGREEFLKRGIPIPSRAL